MRNNKSQVYNINQWARQHPDLVFNDNFVNQRQYLDNDTWDILADYYKDTKPGDKVYNYFPDRIRAGWFSEHSKPSIPENRLQRALTNRRKVRQRFDTTNDRLNLEEKYRTVNEVYPQLVYNQLKESDWYKDNLYDPSLLPDEKEFNQQVVVPINLEIDALRSSIPQKEEGLGPALDRQWPEFIAEATGIPSLVYNSDGTVNNGSLLNKAYRAYRKYVNPLKEATGISGTGDAVIIDLSNNALRVTPNTNQENILFNEFYETKNPSVYRAKDIKNGVPSTLSDNYIPLENLSIYAGVEGDKFKAGPIDIFNDSTYVYPARNVKHDMLPAAAFNIGFGEQLPDKRVNQFFRGKGKELQDQLLYDIMNKEGWDRIPDTPSFDFMLPLLMNTANGHVDKEAVKAQMLREIEEGEYYAKQNPDTYAPRIAQFKNYYNIVSNMEQKEMDDLVKKQNIQSAGLTIPMALNYSQREQPSAYSYTDIKGKTKPVKDWNASILDGKFILANPEGGLFINRPQDLSQEQLDTINEYLREHPSWIVRPDLGGFGQTYLDKPTLKQYTSQYSENLNMFDPNYYVVGTNNKPM